MAGERTLPGLDLTGFWTVGSDGWDVGMGSNLRKLSAVTQLVVISKDTALPASPSLGDIYLVPSGDLTNPDKVAVWDGSVGVEDWVYITPTEGWMAYVTDLTDTYRYESTGWEVFTSGGGAATSTYDFRFSFTDTPVTDEVLDTIMIVRDVDLPAGLAGSLGQIATNPTASFVMSLQDDAVEIATITIGTDGAFTFATTSGTAKTVASGSVLTLVAPTTVDATAANATITLAGSA